MIHCTTYASPMGSNLGGLIEVYNKGKVVESKTFNRKTVSSMHQRALVMVEQHEQTGVAYKQQTISLREYYGIK